MSLEQDLDQCCRGNHKLKVIYRSNQVIRWCEICGCIMVDVETDGRTRAITTKSPKIFRRA